MAELRKIEQRPCDREGCTSEATNHYHCGRCTSPEVTSMLGHYRRDASVEPMREWYTCKPEDLPSKLVAGCGCQYDSAGRVFVDHCVCGPKDLPTPPAEEHDDVMDRDRLIEAIVKPINHNQLEEAWLLATEIADALLSDPDIQIVIGENE